MPLLVVLCFEDVTRIALCVEFERGFLLLMQPEKLAQHHSGCTLEAVDDAVCFQFQTQCIVIEGIQPFLKFV